MATITAAMVKDLRESTGAGMMDCKAALTETGGDMTAAQDWLRKKGLSKAAKKAGRVAADGLIGALTKANKGVVIAVSCNAATFARDARILVDGGFQIESVTPLDQFRFSAHVEIAAVFRRLKPKARARRLL